jgi:hypothetical protein
MVIVIRVRVSFRGADPEIGCILPNRGDRYDRLASIGSVNDIIVNGEPVKVFFEEIGEEVIVLSSFFGQHLDSCPERMCFPLPLIS